MRPSLLLLGVLACLGLQAQAFTPLLKAQRAWTPTAVARRPARTTATQMVMDPASILTDVARCVRTLL